MRVAVAADHAGMALRGAVVDAIRAAGAVPVVLELADAGPSDDYPDAALLVGKAIAAGDVTRGVLVCGSGAGVAIAAGKLPLVRAASAHDTYTAHQMVEHDDANVLAIGSRVVGEAVASELVAAFVGASFSAEERHARRLRKVLDIHGGLVNPPLELHRAGQSIWLDNINRGLLRSGSLARYIDQLGVSGLTSNPSILSHALSDNEDYDDSIRACLDGGMDDPQDIAYAVALEDLSTAAELLRPTWEATMGADGYVSVEVPPALADSAGETVAFARRLAGQVGRPNVLIKVPGTPAGLDAAEELLAGGIGVNVTLLFSVEHYQGAAEAYLRALERRRSAGEALRVASVASVFVSRWDVAANPLLPSDLREQLGVAVMQEIYAAYLGILGSKRWKSLEGEGALAQRVLWASTSTKDPASRDTYYVGKLAAPGTIDTIPDKTLLAFARHGDPTERLQPDKDGSAKVIAAIERHGVDVAALGVSLQREGAASFEADWEALLGSVAAKAASLAGTGADPASLGTDLSR